MKVVLDTNVLLAAMFTRGLCESLLDECLTSGRSVVLCDHIINEFIEHAAGKFGAPKDSVERAIRALRANAVFVDPAVVPADSCRDADDLPVLGAAVAGAADLIVTGDRDLLTLAAFRGIRILSPREFHTLIHGKG